MSSQQYNEPDERPFGKGSATDHLANERTFLAWIRTSIGLMAFGFAVAKFTLFVKQLSYSIDHPPIASRGFSSSFGILLVAIGALLGILAFLRYRYVEKQLQKGLYTSAQPLIFFLAGFILLTGILLILYLMNII